MSIRNASCALVWLLLSDGEYQTKALYHCHVKYCDRTCSSGLPANCVGAQVAGSADCRCSVRPQCACIMNMMVKHGCLMQIGIGREAAEIDRTGEGAAG